MFYTSTMTAGISIETHHFHKLIAIYKYNNNVGLDID